MVMREIDEKVITDFIEILRISGQFSVERLAEEFSVSRSYFYKYYKHLLPETGRASTEKRIKDVIKILRERTGKKKLSISAVADQANISRQTLSGNYKYLYPYIRGEADFEDTEEPAEANLAREVRLLNKEVADLKDKHENDLKEAKQGMLTQLMILDLKSFGLQTSSINLNKLQIQNDELVSKSKENLMELAKLRAERVDLKKRTMGNVNSEVLAHFIAKYDAIEEGMSDRDTMKLFLKAEQRNMEAAIEACITSKPDVVLLFQPLLSCSIDDFDIQISGKRVVIIESNCFLASDYAELISNLPHCKINAISAKNIAIFIANFFCRTAHARKFSESFLNKLYDKVCYPSLEDGFFSIAVFSPTQYVKAVEE